jgi:ferrous iron transport protein B
MAFRFALVGNPNCGKTTLFNHLTGSTAHVGNWPGVTVDIREGKWQEYKSPRFSLRDHHHRLHGREIHGHYDVNPHGDIFIVDLPGIYSLSPYSPEEVVSRNYILSGGPDVCINVVDATNLERNLYLTTQVMEMDTPMVVALNMMDMIEKNGDQIDIKGLERVLGVPVVPIAAAQNRGIAELMHIAVAVAGRRRKAATVLQESVLGESISDVARALGDTGGAHSLYYAVKMLEGDEDAFRNSFLNGGVLKKGMGIAARARAAVGDIEAVVADSRYKYITKHCSPQVVKNKSRGESSSNRADKLLTHRLWGIPIFALMMFLIFHLTFGENLFFLKGVPAPGTWLAGLVEGGVRAATGAAAAFLDSAGLPLPVRTLLVDGVFAGVGAVIGFIPLVLVLYFFIQILEDTGYMARAAFLMDRLMRKFGISGRSFVPLMMGFGCSVPAIAGTKTLVNERDRRITIMLIPFMSCGAKIPVYALIVPAFFPRHTDLVIAGFYFFGIATALLAGFVLKKAVFQGNASPFILELPPYRIPTPVSLGRHLWEKLKDFAVRVGVVITAATIVIWFFSNFGFTPGKGFGMMAEPNSASSILGLLGNALRFIFAPLGFGGDPSVGWKAVVAVLSGLVAREAVVSTMGQLFAGAGNALAPEAAAGAVTAAMAAAFSPPAALALLTWNLLSTPCMAAIGAIKSEMNSAKWFWGTMAFHAGVAWVMAFLVNWIGTLVMMLSE